MAAKAAHAALERREDPLRGGRAGVRRLRLRRQHVRAARGLRGWAHGHPRLQREQQLLDRIDRADARQAGRRGRHRRVRARRRASRRWRRARSGRSTTTARAPSPSTRRRCSTCRASRRRRRPRRCSAARAASTAGSTAPSARPSRRSARRRASTPSNNPYALFNTRLSVEEVMASEEVFDPLTRYQCCPPDVRRRRGDRLLGRLRARSTAITSPVWIAAQAMTTDYKSSFEKSMIKMVGYDMTVNAAQEGLRAGGPRPGRRAGRASCTTASRPTRSSPTRGSACAAKARPRSSSGTSRTRTAARS